MVEFLVITSILFLILSMVTASPNGLFIGCFLLWVAAITHIYQDNVNWQSKIKNSEDICISKNHY